MTPKKIALLTDSCVDLPKALMEEYHIYSVPLRIRCEDGEYSDGVDICASDVYAKLHAGELPQTSLPAGEDIEQVFERILADGYDSIIAIMLSSGLSGTYNLMRLTAEDWSGRLEIRVFDSLNGSLGQGLILLQTAEELRAGASWEELTQRRIPFLIEHTWVFFSVDTLEYLKKGGRIGKVTAAAGTLLHIKPILGFAPDGQLTSMAKVRGRQQVIEKLVELAVKAYGGCGKRYNLAVANGGAPAEMETVRAKLEAALPHSEHLWWGEIDGTLSVYIGDGVLGSAVQVLE